MTLTNETAQKMIIAALAKSADIGSASSIAILDAGRELVAFSREDSAVLASIEIAQNKAYTAMSMRTATADLEGGVQPGAPFYGLHRAQSRPFVTFGGGLPITVEGKVIGAIGVAGGSIEQDVAVATAGLSAV